MHATHNSDVDLMIVQSLSSPFCACQSMEEVNAFRHRLAELSHMLSIDELPVVPETPKNREVIAEHSFSINGDVGLPGHFCTVQAEEDCLTFGCVKCQSRQATTLSTSGCMDATIMSLLRALRCIAEHQHIHFLRHCP